jgi:hypothetical protein
MHDATVRSSITIDTSIDRVFDFLVSPAKIPLVLPGLVENYDIPPLPLAPGSSFHFRYQMYGVMLEGTWKVTKLEKPVRYEASTTGDVASEWKYELSKRDGSTNINMVVAYETPRTVLQKIKSDVMLKINQQEAEHYLKNLKTVLEMQPV